MKLSPYRTLISIHLFQIQEICFLRSCVWITPCSFHCGYPEDVPVSCVAVGRMIDSTRPTCLTHSRLLPAKGSTQQGNGVFSGRWRRTWYSLKDLSSQSFYFLPPSPGVDLHYILRTRWNSTLSPFSQKGFCVCHLEKLDQHTCHILYYLGIMSSIVWIGCMPVCNSAYFV
jgi:hypothetical protein